VIRASLRAVYVSETAGKNRGRRNGMRARWHEQAILKDIVELADLADLDIKTAVRSGKPAADAILGEVGRGSDKLIVMGVARPSGEPLFFGEIAAAVLEKSPASTLLIAS
jgi:nucleotide-binding universal stress UspA family protein